MKIREQIFKKYYDGGAKVLVEHLPEDVLPTDEINIERNDSFYSENESYDAYTVLAVFRERDETEDERNVRLSKIESAKIKNKAQRYETYLKLKQEFESL